MTSARDAAEDHERIGGPQPGAYVGRAGHRVCHRDEQDGNRPQHLSNYGAELQGRRARGSECRGEAAIEDGLVGRKQNGYRLMPILGRILFLLSGFSRLTKRACGGLLRMNPRRVCQRGRFGGFFRRATSLLRVVVARRGSLRHGGLDGLRKQEVLRQLADNLLGRSHTRSQWGQLGLVKRDSSSAEADSE